MIGRFIIAGALGTGLLAAAPVAAQLSYGYSNLHVFGDSLVDSGNAQELRRLTGGADPAPEGLGFDRGRFSNGPNFADRLSTSLFGREATASAFGGTNFSVGGAQAAEVPGAASPSFAEQISGGPTTFPFSYDLSGSRIDANSLVLVTLGGNDVRAELLKLRTPGYMPTVTPALDALEEGLRALFDRGARNIVVTGLPDIGQIPAVTLLGNPLASAAGTQLSFGLNQAIGGLVGDLRGETGYNLRFFDLFAFQRQLYADPAAFGITGALNTRDACLRTPGAAPACTNFVYFDDVHPTAQIHAAIGDALFRTAVPEPATWAMMIAGFAAVGLSLRRRGGMAVAA